MVRKLGFLFLFISLLLCACQSEAASGLQISDLSGEVQVQRGGQGEFVPLQEGDRVSAGDRVRAVYAENTFVELSDARALTAVLPGSSVLIQSLSADPALTETRILLEEGSVYATAEKPLGEGLLEILTLGGTAALQGSGMLVTFDSNTSNTSVDCTDGSVSASAGGQTVSLQAGQSTAFVPSGVPENPGGGGVIKGDLSPFGRQIFQDKYMDITLEDQSAPTEIIYPSRTVRPSLTPSLTTAATQTPFEVGPTATVRADSTEPTRRPTSTRAPGAEGLSPEEEINQGSHVFMIGCQAWGDCVCDSALANPQQTIEITFENGGVTLSGEGAEETLFYPQAAPNLYQIVEPALTAEITFLPEGFEFLVIKGGRYCSLQTFTRQP